MVGRAHDTSLPAVTQATQQVFQHFRTLILFVIFKHPDGYPPPLQWLRITAFLGLLSGSVAAAQHLGRDCVLVLPC